MKRISGIILLISAVFAAMTSCGNEMNFNVSGAALSDKIYEPMSNPTFEGFWDDCSQRGK